MRKSSLATKLAMAAFDIGLRNDVIWNFIDCNDHLVEFFAKMGFTRTHEVEHEEYGRVNAMRLNIREPSRLAEFHRAFEGVQFMQPAGHATSRLAGVGSDREPDR